MTDDQNEPVVNEPVLDGATEAGVEEKIAGLVEQLAADSVGQERPAVVEAVIQRFNDAGIVLDEATLEEVVSEIVDR
jgi:hypothetical protein